MDNNLEGGAGNDTLIGGAGNNTLDGGEDSDTANYSDSSSGITITIDGDTITISDGLGGTDTVSNIETFIGSSYSDTVVATGRVSLSDYTFTDFEAFDINVIGANIDGTELDDLLTGDNSDNTINGLGGDDTLSGGEGADVLSGGDGTDTIDYSSSTSGIDAEINYTYGIIKDGFGDTDSLATTNRLIDIEAIVGSDYDDEISFPIDSGLLIFDFSVSGGSGNDTLFGFWRINDLDYDGGAGTDTIDNSIYCYIGNN